MFGVIGSALAGIASSLYDNRKNRKSTQLINERQIEANKALMERQADLDRQYAQWSASELPLLNRQGMESAGFNPILAITNGTGVQGSVSGSAASLSVPQSDTAGVASSLSSAVDQYIRLRQAKSGLEIADEQKKFIGAKTKESEAKAEQIHEQIKNPSSLFSALGKAGERLIDFFGSGDAKSLKHDSKKAVRKVYKQVNNYYNYMTGSAKSLDGRSQ